MITINLSEQLWTSELQILLIVCDKTDIDSWILVLWQYWIKHSSYGQAKQVRSKIIFILGFGFQFFVSFNYTLQFC